MSAPSSAAAPAPPRRAVVSWSTGKDSAWSLAEVRAAGQLDVVGILTTVTRDFDRVSMHGVRRAVLDLQATALGLPVYAVEIPHPCPNAVYEEAMRRVVERLRADRVEVVVFGDLYLEDIRRYREDRLRGTGLEPAFPLWGRPTRPLAEAMIDGGLRATVVAVDPNKIPGTLAGRPFDRSFLADLPSGADPCGENGEFHTCVTAGPMWAGALPVRTGEVVERDGFVFADVVPEDRDFRPRPAATPATRAGRGR